MFYNAIVYLFIVSCCFVCCLLGLFLHGSPQHIVLAWVASGNESVYSFGMCSAPFPERFRVQGLRFIGLR